MADGLEKKKDTIILKGCPIGWLKGWTDGIGTTDGTMAGAQTSQPES